MIYTIEYPNELTYWIAYDVIQDPNVVYGTTSPQQVTTSGRDNLWYTTNEQEWIDKLLNDFGIII